MDGTPGRCGLSHRYAVDSLVVRNGRCFGWGWFLDDRERAVQCELRLPLRDGGEQTVTCVPGGMRDDLRRAYPDVKHAASAGFMVQGKLSGALDPARRAQLVATLADGAVHYCEVSLAPPGGTLLSRLHGKLRQAGFRGTVGAARRRLSEGLREAASRLWLPIRLWAWRGAAVTVVFDHGMGGGANRYRHGLVDRLAPGGPVIVVSPVLDRMSHRVDVHHRGRSRQYDVQSLQTLLNRLSRLALTMHVNELVSFDDPVGLLDWLRRQRARQGGAQGELVFYLHDYHAVCPAWTLIDHAGRYCGVPDMNVCRACLPANAANTMGFSPDVAMPAWRAAWGQFLDDCDRVVAFSRASVDILAKAYPTLRAAKIVVQPHTIDTSGLRELPLQSSEPLVIGVAGHISAAKGALILRDMAKLIRTQGLAVRIVVFGTLEHHDGEDGIEVLGAYQSGALPDLLEKHRVGVCFLPSVCAETFSFVTSELMAMHVPMAVFPIGAPAERVADYDRGLVISRIDAGVALEEITAFAGRLLTGSAATTKQQGH